MQRDTRIVSYIFKTPGAWSAVAVLGIVVWLYVGATSAHAACTTSICSGNPCTITGTHSLDDFCVLDFGTKDVTIAAGAVLASAEPDAGEFTILARKLTHRGLLRAQEGFITIVVAEDFITAGTNGRINANGDDGGGFVEIFAAGAVSIATAITATPDGFIDISGCGVTLSGSLDAGAGGTVNVQYRQSATFVSGAAMHAEDDGGNSLECRDDGNGNCPVPSGLTCVPGQLGIVCTGAGMVIDPPASLDPLNLGACAGCGNHVVEPGEACDEGDLDECGGCSSTCQLQGQGEVCAGDGNPCTIDVCDASSCTHLPVSGSCDDGNACTSIGQCSGGACVPGPPVVCNDGKPCTTDACTPLSGCMFTPNNGLCNDGNPCTTDVCNGTTGSCVTTPNTSPCDDDNACTLGDQCAGGRCGGSFDPACLVPILMLLQPVCGDAVVEAGEQCDDGNVAGGDCCSATCQFEPGGSFCQDGKVCTQGDVCNGVGGCVPGPACLAGLTCNVCGAKCGLNGAGSCVCGAQ